MESLSSRSSDLFSPASALIEGALASAQNRIQLLSVELQQEKLRFTQMIIFAAATVFAGVMAVAFTAAAVVCFFWETARLATLIGGAMFFLASVLALGWWARRFVASQPRPFAGTLSELEKDRACFRPSN